MSMLRKYPKVKNAYFVGRGFDYKLALEASLKLKEVSYIHSEATYAGRIKTRTDSFNR